MGEEAKPVSNQPAERLPDPAVRRRLTIAIVAVALLLLCFSCGTVRYLRERKPLTELPAVQSVAKVVPPHYLFSIYGVSEPHGVAVSPDGRRIFVTETGGQRTVRAFDRDGRELGNYAPPDVGVFSRAPDYVAQDRQGRLFVSDRIRHTIDIYAADGTYVGEFPRPDLGDELPSLGRALRQGPAADSSPSWGGSYRVYDRVTKDISLYAKSGEFIERFPEAAYEFWSPLGLSFDRAGRFYVTDVTAERHRVFVFDAQGQLVRQFGRQGEAPGQFLFPNGATTDGRGRIIVSDGNNGRVQVFSSVGRLYLAMGRSAGDASINLPRGVAVDEANRLYVVDAVGQHVLVFDATDQPKFLFMFGEPGAGDGQFGYPTAIAVDNTGRLYVADRANDRVQVWSY